MNPETGGSLTLGTGRLLLRPLSEADAGALHRVSNEPLVRRYLRDDEPVSRARIGKLVAESERMFTEENLGLFGVRPRGGEELVGFCGFLRLEGMEEPEPGGREVPRLRRRTQFGRRVPVRRFSL